MKKLKIICVIMALACMTTAWAQRDITFDRELSVGVKGGVTIPNMAFSPSIQQNTWVGYTTGLTFRYIEENIFGLIAGLNFTQRGWDEKFEKDPYHYRHTLDYIEIPFLAHIYFGSDVVRGFVNIGPQIGILYHDNAKADFDINNLPTFNGENRINEVYTLPIANRFDYGITGGVGVELRLKRHIILLEGRYYFGLGDIYGNRKADIFSGSSANRGFMINLAYMFRIW